MQSARCLLEYILRVANRRSTMGVNGGIVVNWSIHRYYEGTLRPRFWCVRHREQSKNQWKDNDFNEFIYIDNEFKFVNQQKLTTESFRGTRYESGHYSKNK